MGSPVGSPLGPVDSANSALFSDFFCGFGLYFLEIRFLRRQKYLRVPRRASLATGNRRRSIDGRDNSLCSSVTFLTAWEACLVARVNVLKDMSDVAVSDAAVFERDKTVPHWAGSSRTTSVRLSFTSFQVGACVLG